MGNQRRILIITSILVLLAGLGGAYWYFAKNLVSPIPALIKASAAFPILYPTKLPAGFNIDSSKFSESKDSVIYSAANTAGQEIAFTVQPRPTSFDFNKFYSQVLSNSTVFTTTVGQAAIGQANGRLLGSIYTDQSWLLVSSASQQIQSSDLRLILDNLKIER